MTIAVILLVFIVLAVIAVRPAQVWQALREVQGVKPWIAIALNPVVVVLWTTRSTLVLRRMGKRMPLSVLLPVTVLGNVIGSLTPGASGEVLRTNALQRSAGLRLDEALTLVAFERVLSSYTLLLFTLGCLALLNLPAVAAGGVMAVCAILLLLPWLSALFLLPYLPKVEQITPTSLPARILRYGLGLAWQVRDLLLSLRLLLTWCAVTLTSFGVVACQFLLVADSLGASIDFVEAGIAFGLGGFAALISLLPLGLGVGDGSIAAVIHQLGGISFERATAIAVLIRATVTTPLMLLALISYLFLLKTGAPVRPAPAVDEPAG